MTVSVIINNFNYGRFLKEAIDSCLAQTYRDVEVIVVDDGSTDESRAVIAEYGDRVKAVLKPNGGQSSALNAGFALSGGKFICLLDSDDWYFPDKIESVVRSFESSPDVGWVFDPVMMTFADGSARKIPFNSDDIYVDGPGLATKGKSGPLAPPTSGLSFARPLLQRLLPMSEQIRVCSDNYLKFAGVSIAPGLQLGQAHTAQRIHDSNVATLRTDKLLMKAQLHLLIARELKINFPAASRLSDKIFSKAAADYVRCLRRDQTCQAAIAQYFEKCSVGDVLDIVPRTAFNIFRRIGSTG